MSRYTGPTTRINRRFGQAIFPPNKAFERRAYPPGVHGPRLRRRVTDYSIGLNEKQKLRYMFGLSEKQFRLTFDRAKTKRGVTGQIFLQLLETRLDSIVYRLGLSKTRSSARQFVNHGHVRVNGHKVDIASYNCQPGDVVEVRDRSASKQLATRCMEESQARTVPAWLTLHAEGMKGTVNRLPSREEMVTEININEQLIVEFYSR
ncbi:MAG: 30S ribosomal protein S4 [Verrucomicrobia bacterium GWF2_51_19]|nr:MAG: 30S ribosomal protein S4 [Verrucomicrobia bacterium GWF2_51_19]HCJ12595.1 30S ribosomal protein S4 [Opitutae bacterium]